MMDTNDRLNPISFFAVRQEAVLKGRLDRGATLTQRRADGRWVERRGDGTETELPIRDRPGT